MVVPVVLLIIWKHVLQHVLQVLEALLLICVVMI